MNKLVFLLLSLGLGLANIPDGKKDLMLYELSKFPGFIQPSGYLNYNNIYKKITKINYTAELNYAAEKELNDSPFGKTITINFYRINHPIMYFDLHIPFMH